LAIDVAGFNPGQADQLRRAFGRRHNDELLKQFHQQFMNGARSRGVDDIAAENIFNKFNGQYMFPESHAFAFGVTAYQASWLKYHHPLEFFVGIFNQQPMGFYSLETLKEDARRHGIRVLNPDINKSWAVCVIENNAVRLGFLSVLGLGSAAVKDIESGRAKQGTFGSIGQFLENTGVLEEVADNLADAGAFDSLEPNRRNVKWEIGLRYRPINSQLSLPLPVQQDMAALQNPSDWEKMQGEYNVLSLFPAGHIMSRIRPQFQEKMTCSKDIPRLRDGAEVTIAGLVIRRQRPRGKVVFITLEDEFGHIPLMVFPQVYESQENKFKSPFLIIKGTMARREGTCNVVVNEVQPFNALDKTLQSKDWR
jgi:error-prone DNA polymerase